MRTFRLLFNDEIIIRNGDLIYRDSLYNFIYDCETLNIELFTISPKVSSLEIYSDDLSYAILENCHQIGLEKINLSVEFFDKYIDQIKGFIECQYQRLLEKNKPKELTQDEIINKSKIYIQSLLLKSDWTQLPDVNLSQDEKKEWVLYRKSLREFKIPLGIKFEEIVFPKSPDE